MNQEHYDRLIRSVKEWNDWRKESDERPDLRYARLCAANLRGANLRGAELYGVDLRGAHLAWQSHDLIAEILRQAARKNKVYRSVAGLVLISHDLCWEELAAAVTSKQRNWAFGVLAQWADENTPRVLREWMQERQ